MLAWLRTPRGSTTTALVVAVILALLWFDPWNRPLPARFALDGGPAPGTAPQPTSGGPATYPAAPQAEPAVAAKAPTAPAPNEATGSGPDKSAVTAAAPPAGSAAPAPDVNKQPSASTAADSTSPAAAGEGAGAAAPTSGEKAAPSFDIVRVEPDGSTVIAGRGEPGSEVVLLDGDKPVARAPVDGTGQFALLPPTLETGDHTLALETRRADRAPVRSAQSVAVSVARTANTRPLVALLSPDKPAEVLSDGTSGPPSAAPAPNTPGGAAAVPAKAPLPLAIQSVEARQAGQFMASGVAKPGTSNRVYLNGSFVAEVTAGPNGRWSVEVQKGMTPGRYLVRADQVEPSNGKVVSRVEVPFDYPNGVASDGRPVRLAQGGVAQLRDASAHAGGSSSALPNKASPSPRSALATGKALPQGSTTSQAATQLQAGPQSQANPQLLASAQPPTNALTGTGSPPQSGVQPQNGAQPRAGLSSPGGMQPPSVRSASGAPLQSAAAPQAPASQGSATGAATASATPGTVANSSAGAAAAPAAEQTAAATAGAAAPDLPPQGSASAVVPDLKTTTVSRGDSLWRISRQLLGHGIRYTEIYASNAAQIRDPALIYPGQVFVLPTQRVD